MRQPRRFAGTRFSSLFSFLFSFFLLLLSPDPTRCWTLERAEEREIAVLSPPPGSGPTAAARRC